MVAKSSTEKRKHEVLSRGSAVSILIIGAGVFGLSTALHLLENGYRDVSILDAQQFDKSNYSPYNGADSASSDTRKVIRAAYGSKGHYTSLAMEAVESWKSWNKEASHPLLINSGWARTNDKEELLPVEVKNFKTMEALGLRESQYQLADTAERERAISQGWSDTKVDPFGRTSNGLPLGGVFDSSAGFLRASDACTFVLEKVKQLGGKTVLGPAGRVSQLLYASEQKHGDQRRVLGVKTEDGKLHRSDVVIVAAGAHTHVLVPASSDILTAAAGTVAQIKVPIAQQERYRPDNFPISMWNYTGEDESGSFTVFPLDEYGTVKILHNAPQWRNTVYHEVEGAGPAHINALSIPTSWSLEERTNVPKASIECIKRFISENVADLSGAEIVMAKLCWDSRSIDDDFLIDWVPGLEGCIVVSGGSNHGFKFLPTLGKYVLKVLQGQHDEYTKLWQWRTPSEREVENFKDLNLSSIRALSEQKLSSSLRDLEW
ncbi:sarcosine oxidase [Xylona heveae TC161]|uniref:Sarcosine oxidase n=1 Tax=Xylona heveae (strain CBS 132557 / TC161) TaxID=1328760 RepID=A0A165AF42_XYLHT|nr:sarcosine oxidase [Xylona heveae TC161]KZF20373.1 sarcosine oxidase [Xylona heveae TC161]